MTKFYKKTFHILLIILGLLLSPYNAQAALSKGDLAVIGMNGDADANTTIRSFAVVALNTINAGEVIYFTDRGWVNTYGSTAGHFVGAATTPTPSIVITNEGVFQWQPSAAIPAGTVIIFKINLGNGTTIPTSTVSATKGDGSSLPSADFSILSNSWTNTTLSTNPWPPATGDQILIYQGSASSPSFIFAFNNIRLNASNVSNGWHVNSSSTEPNNQLAAYSELPSDLGTTYSTAFFTNTANSRYTNVKYNPTSASGTKTAILEDITNTAKWINTTTSGTPYIFNSGFGAANITQFNIGSPTVSLSDNPTISFSNDSGFSDHMALDGEGGSLTISDINIQIYPIDNAGTKLTATPLEYHNGTHSGWTGYPSIIVYGVTPDTPYYGWVIKSDNGDDFALRSLNFLDWGNFNGAQFTIEAFNGGVSKGTATFTGNINTSFVALTNSGILGNVFKNVDEIRIYQTNQANSYISLNDIGIGPAVVSSNTPPTVTAARISISGASGTGGAFKIGDVVTASWNNTAGGDNNSGITAVTIDFSQFGGGTAVTAANSNGTWTATYTIAAGTITSTSRNVALTATNSAGPTTVTDDANATVDNVAPTVAISSTAGASGGSTGTSPIPFTVSFSESVTGFVAGDITPGNATISGFSGSGTTYTFNATPTANGAVTMNIAANAAQDAVGNGNTAASQFSITYAQAVTAAPVVVSPANGSFINTTTPTYAGTATAGATVTVYVDGSSSGTTTAAGGNWSLSQPTALAQGAHTVYATAQVTGNAVSTNSNTNTFTVDSNRPTVVISSTAGASGGSTSTSPIPFTVTFSESVTGFVAGDITPGNATISGFSGSGTTYTFNATPTANGTVTMNVAANAAQDAAGNGNTAASQFAITYAQAVTAAPVLVSPANGSFINTTTPTYAGTATAGAAVTVYVDGSSSGTTTAAGGNWSLSQPTALAQGAHTVYATAQVTGNAVSTNSNTNTFTVDSNRPTVVISSTAGASGGSTSTSPIPFTVTFSESVTGFVAGDITPGNATISGFSGSGTTYTFNATPTANGTVTMNVAANVAQDAAGNGNTAASQLSITYAQAVTAAPVLVSPANGSFINTTTPTYAGTATAGAAVTVYVDGSSSGTTTATGGNWSLSQPTALAQGAHTVYATAQVTGNAVSTNSNTNTFTVDSNRPTVVISSTAGASGGSTSTSPIPFTVTFSESVTGFVAGDITPGNATISGFSGSGTTYTFNAAPTANGAVTMNVAANAAQDAAGNGNTAASQFSITYAQAVTAAPVLVSPANGSFINTTTPTYAGTATAGATVTVYVDGSSSGTTTATGGNWSLSQPTALAQGAHTVYATAQVTGNAVSTNSNTNTFTVDSNRPTVVISSTAGASGGSTSTSPIPFTVTFSESVTGFVAGDITPGNATLSGFSGSGTTYTFNATPTANGAVTMNVAANVAQDAAGNGNTAASQFSITYTQPSQITTSAGTFPSSLSTTYGTASAATSITVSGTGLSAGITAAPSSTSNFEVSADNVNYSSSVNIGSSGNVSGTVYVRLKANAPAGANITGNVMLTSSGANSPTISIPSSTVTKATLIYTANILSKAYGNVVPALSGTVSGFANSETISTATTGTVSWSTPASSNSAVGSYEIAGAGLSANNYDFVQASSNTTALTVTQRTVTVTVAAKSKTYGDADPALTYDFTPALAAGDTFIGSLARTPGENVGTYSINQNTLALNSNYTVSYVGADLTIGAKTITVAAEAKSKTYGDADPELTYTFAPTLAGTDTFIGSLARTPGENVGTYSINQNTLALNSNYTVSYVGADLTIGAKTITVAAEAKSKTYGDADPGLTYTFAPTLAGTDTFIGSLARTAGENVATYAINQGTLALNSNYTLTYLGADLTIGAKTITVAAEAKSKTYGDADPGLTYTFAPTLAGTDTFSGSLARTPGENVGTYAINQGTLALNSNYTLTYLGADLTIGAKTITVTAEAKSKTYGDADPAFTYSFAPALVTGDSFSGSLARTPGENVGTYAVSQNTLALNSNYTVSYVGADLTIGAKTITVTAAAKSKTYGDADPVLTYTFAPALAGTDTFSGSLARTSGENIGTYAISQNTLALNSNYTVTFVGADLTIGAKTITVLAEAKSKTYGDADPVLTYTFAPALAGTDTFSGSLARTAGENIGTYAISQNTLALNSNYTVSYVGADLTIDAKTITVTAAAKSKTYGDADPALTYNFAPALAGTDTFSGSLARTPGENIGTHAINQGTLALNSNYKLTFRGADLTIAAKTITVKANTAQSKIYGTADPVYTYSFSPTLISGDSFTGTLSRAAGNDAGTYPIIQGTLNAGTNYTIIFVPSDFTIVKADQTIAWNQTLAFGCEGESTLVLTASSSSNLPVSYTSSNSSLVSISGNVLNVQNYGSVNITAAQSGNNNYNAAAVVSLPLVRSQPNLIRKQFENVIFFDNSSKSFNSYTWYKNGVLVPGQTNQYYKENGPLNGTYHAVAIRLDGTAVTTCPIVLSPAAEQQDIKIVPNPVKPNANYDLVNNVPVSLLQNARVQVYSITGQLIEDKTISQNTETFQAPAAEGIYIIRMTLSNGKYFSKNLLVKF